MQSLQRSREEGIASTEIDSARIEVMKAVAYSLLRQVYGVSSPQKLDVRSGINLHDEVRCYEISLIRQALFYTNGKQSAAAALLNLSPSTLHAKLKTFGLEVQGPRSNPEFLQGTFA